MRKFNDPNEVSGGVLNTVPLNDAACNGDLSAVKSLLSMGALPDGVDETAITPLMEASREGYADIVELLINSGADVNRMGFVQRYYSLDFASWMKSDKKTIQVLTSAGALKVDSKIDWKCFDGWEVIFHVSKNYAAIYPVPFERDVGGVSFKFWLGNIRAESEMLYIFSAGLYKFSRNVEFGIVVPSEWALLNNYNFEKSIFSFPLDFLQRVALRVKKGVAIKGGYFVTPDDPDFCDLSWPGGVKGMVAVDHLWVEGDNCSESVISPDDVKIYTFAPMILKSFKASEASLSEVAEKLKISKSKKIALPYYWKERL